MSGPRYQVGRIADRGDPGYDSWIVFDTAHVNAHGEFAYLCDCINQKAARLVAAALNSYAPEIERGKRITKALEAVAARRAFTAEARAAERDIRRGGRTYSVKEAFNRVTRRKGGQRRKSQPAA